MIKGHDIICISTSDWNRPWGSRQQLMLRLSATNRVLYVEYQASFLHLFLYARIKNRANRLRKVNENLFVFTPYRCLPFGYYFRGINRINQRIILWSLRKILKKMDFVNPIIWIYPPCAVDLLGRLNEKLVLYHCIADFANEKGNCFRHQTISSMEKELVEKSDIVLTLSSSLHARYKNINTNTHLFPSAFDEKEFQSFSDGKNIPEDIASLKRPRIGLVGYLDGNVLDVDLLCDVADKRQEWSLILIGPRFRHARRFNSLKNKRNVFFLDEKKNSEIPAYLKNLDVCIIPYVMNGFTSNISPLKLYEYLALGKPVVSTRLPDLEPFRGVVRLSDSREDFVNNISQSLIENNEELVNKRLDIARKNSWAERLKAVSGFIEESLREKQ